MGPDPTRHARDELIDLSGLYVPLRRCESLTLGKLEPSRVATLERQGYDHAPVCPEPELAIGVIATTTARQMLESGTALDASTPEIDAVNVPVSLPLDSFLETLSTHNAVLVMDGPDRRTALGMLTLSDLNRHLFRARLYPSLARLEARLARAVEMQFSDPWEWLGKLSEDGQASIVGRWELLKRRNLDVGPVVAANLAHLLTVVPRSKPLLQSLGFKSSTAFRKATGHIPEIRNSIMHLVRPLVLGVDDVTRLRDSLRVIERMCDDLGEEEIW